MDILETLSKHSSDLFLEDCEMFLEELEIGEYSKSYKEKCKHLIKLRMEELLKQNAENITKNDKSEETKEKGFQSFVSYEDLTNCQNQVSATKEEILFKDINFYRKNLKHIENFSKLLAENLDFFTVEYFEKNIKNFEQTEIDEILKQIQFEESFLEMNYSILNKSVIGKYQKFSEEFFMKHFNDFAVSTVLKSGVNEWRYKKNRSSKLTVFLKLKGVTI